MKKKRIIIKNNLNKVFWEKHYSKSRIKSPSNFALFIKSNCRIKYLIERKGLSKFKNDNPVVARLVLEKK